MEVIMSRIEGRVEKLEQQAGMGLEMRRVDRIIIQGVSPGANGPVATSNVIAWKRGGQFFEPVTPDYDDAA